MGATHVTCCTVFVSLVLHLPPCWPQLYGVLKKSLSWNPRSVVGRFPKAFLWWSFHHFYSKRRRNFLTFQACVQFHGSVQFGKRWSLWFELYFCKSIFEICKFSKLKIFFFFSFFAIWKNTKFNFLIHSGKSNRKVIWGLYIGFIQLAFKVLFQFKTVHFF